MGVFGVVISEEIPVGCRIATKSFEVSGKFGGNATSIFEMANISSGVRGGRGAIF